MNSLNPCCNGRGSKTLPSATQQVVDDTFSLNPCCNGRGSKATAINVALVFKGVKVLILVVMEEGQRLSARTCRKLDGLRVLILVVMEEGQRLIRLHSNRLVHQCLNPCCNGRGSKTYD